MWRITSYIHIHNRPPKKWKGVLCYRYRALRLAPRAALKYTYTHTYTQIILSMNLNMVEGYLIHRNGMGIPFCVCFMCVYTKSLDVLILFLGIVSPYKQTDRYKYTFVCTLGIEAMNGGLFWIHKPGSMPCHRKAGQTNWAPSVFIVSTRKSFGGGNEYYFCFVGVIVWVTQSDYHFISFISITNVPVNRGWLFHENHNYQNITFSQKGTHELDFQTNVDCLLQLCMWACEIEALDTREKK